MSFKLELVYKGFLFQTLEQAACTPESIPETRVAFDWTPTMEAGEAGEAFLMVCVYLFAFAGVVAILGAAHYGLDCLHAIEVQQRKFTSLKPKTLSDEELWILGRKVDQERLRRSAKLQSKDEHVGGRDNHENTDVSSPEPSVVRRSAGAKRRAGFAPQPGHGFLVEIWQAALDAIEARNLVRSLDRIELG